MQTAELHTEIIRGVLNIDNVELLQLIKKTYTNKNYRKYLQTNRRRKNTPTRKR